MIVNRKKPKGCVAKKEEALCAYVSDARVLYLSDVCVRAPHSWKPACCPARI